MSRLGCPLFGLLLAALGTLGGAFVARAGRAYR